MLFDPEGPPARPIRYDVEAHPEPGLLCRLLAPLARRGLEPDALQSQRRGERMQCSIRFDAMPSEMIHLVEGNLRQVVGVVRVAVLVGASPREARAAA
jgi:acetolactate synthase regulatory subunit